MDGWCARYLLLAVLELSLVHTVITVLHSGRLNGYALPRPLSGCEEHWFDFTVRLKHTNLTHNTEISDEFKLALDTHNDDNVMFEFCMQNKTSILSSIDDEVVLAWPEGKYCIHSVGKVVKKGDDYEWALGDCPRGFHSGVTALPFKSYPGQRMLNPTSPLSLMHSNITLVHYCCSTTGDVNASIDLGMVAPFVLLPYGQPHCQKVQNMESNLQFIEWPLPEQRWSGSHPYSMDGRRIYYCYYMPLGLGMEHDIVMATFGIAIGTPTLTLIVIGLCKLRAKLAAKRMNFKRFHSVM